MKYRKILLGLCLASLPLGAYAQSGRPIPPRARPAQAVPPAQQAAPEATPQATPEPAPPPIQESVQAPVPEAAPEPILAAPQPSPTAPAVTRETSSDAIAGHATQMLRCQTYSDLDLAIGGCAALIQSGTLSDAMLGGIYARRATLYAQQKNNEQALKDIDQSLLLVQGDARIYALRGDITQAMDMRADAIESYRQCLTRDPTMSKCESNLALLQGNAQKENDACNASGAPDAIIEACTTLIARAPREARYFNSRGVAYFTKKDFRRALEDFSTAIRYAPQDSVILTNRCNAYIQIRQYDRAIDDCDDALRAKRDNGQALYARGLAKFSREDAAGAIADFNAALDNNPPKPGLILGYRGAAYLIKGDHTAAEKDLNEALRLEPDNASARAYLGGLYVEQGQPDKAIKELDAALKLNPALSTALIYRGRAYIKKHQAPRGMRDIDAAVKLEPDNAFVFQARGQIYVSLGQTSKAAADFKACRVLDLFATCGGVKSDGSMPAKPPVATASKPPAKAPVATSKPAAVKPMAKPAAKPAPANAKPPVPQTTKK